MAAPRKRTRRPNSKGVSCVRINLVDFTAFDTPPRFRSNIMAVVLILATGSKTEQRIPVGEGQIVRVGRTSSSDYAFPDDTYLSGVHFEIACNKGECAVRDLGSSNGTFVNGERIEQAP